MRSIQLIGIAEEVTGVVLLLMPWRFYKVASAIFTPSVSPPFSVAAVKLLAYILCLPSLILILNGVALIIVGEKLRRVAELKTFSESGEYMGSVKSVDVKEGEVETFELEGRDIPKEKVAALDEVVIVKEEGRHPWAGREVYSEKGDFLGYVKSVTLDEQRKILMFNAVRGNKSRVVTKRDIISAEEVILVRG